MEERDRARLTPSEGRRFAFPVGLAFLGICALFWWREHEAAALVAGSLAGFLLLAGLVAPTRLGPTYRGWMWLGRAVSRVTTPVILGVLYFAVMTPVGYLRRLLVGNPLDHRAEDDSYWKRRPEGRRQSDLERLY